MTIPIVRLGSVDSTNDEARRRLAAGVAGPFAIVADEQTAGRGTRGRHWDSPAGAGLYLTLAMPGDRWPLAGPGGSGWPGGAGGAGGLGGPGGPAAGDDGPVGRDDRPGADDADEGRTGGDGDGGVLPGAGRPAGPPLQLVHTLAAGVAAAEALRSAAGVEVRLKPVNDLVAGGGKLGGILVETVLRGGRVASMVIGVGINLRGGERRVAEHALPPTSVASLLGGSAGLDPDLPTRLASGLVDGLAAWTARTVRDGEAPIRAAWAAWALPGTAAPRPG